MKQESDSSENEGEFDQGEGTSSGASYRNLPGAKPLTIASLLLNRVLFEKPQKPITTAEIPYDVINHPKPQPSLKSALSSPTPTKLVPSPVTTTTPSSLFFPPIDPAVGWPRQLPTGKGLVNLGNTCFLNSALQVLIHTPPLVRYFITGKHDPASCQMRSKKGFCTSCAVKATIDAAYKSDRSPYIAPRPVVDNLRKIASNMRPGRQEDAHEFLRFCIDGMALGCLFGKSPKVDIKIKESTFIHQIFGGRLRSRVTCSVCQHPSDTFDSMLDLSLDVQRVDSIKEALAQFVRVDVLKGANKYKCEKCKKLVTAEKNFTIHEAPMVLTIHLKRFTAAGRKIGDQIKYPEIFNLSPYMSDKSESPTYRLFGVINHSGGGPHSGHYTANVRSSNGSWHHMNDESVTSSSNAPLNAKSAYVLFYCRERGDGLNAIINGSSNGVPNGVGMVNGAGKRGRESDVSMSNGKASKKAFIGPQIPTITTVVPRPLSTPNPFVPVSPATSRSPSHSNPFSPPQGSPPSSITSSIRSNGNDRRINAEDDGLFKSNARKQGKQYGSKGKQKVVFSTTGALKPRMIRS